MRAIVGKWLLVVMVLLVLAGCGKAPDAERLRAQVAQMQEAVTARSPDQVMQWLSEDFTGNAGMDRKGVERLLRLQLLRHARVGLVVGPLDVRVDGDHAQVDFTVAMAGSSSGYLPETGRVHAVSTHWRRRGSDWELYRARWGDGQGH